MSILRALRATLQLNVSACASKLQDWPTARRACELVLACEPSNVKALYKLAKAHDGAGDVSLAISVLSGQLLKQDPKHREARTLLEELRRRQKEERRMFGGLFVRAQGEGTADDGIYSENALEREARRRQEDKDKLAKIENFAKLPPDMWAETFGDLRPDQMQKMIPENKELGAWRIGFESPPRLARLAPLALPPLPCPFPLAPLAPPCPPCPPCPPFLFPLALSPLI